jgi:hypothetical protein
MNGIFWKVWNDEMYIPQNFSMAMEGLVEYGNYLDTESLAKTVKKDMDAIKSKDEIILDKEIE